MIIPPESLNPGINYPGEPADIVMADPPYGQTTWMQSFLKQLVTAPQTPPSYPSLQAADILFVKRDVLISGPRPDIEMHEIEPSSVAWPNKPDHEKSPLLQELRTPEQIREHFLALPRVTQRIDEWLVCKRDLLFLGLPFCGKTSLLTYLAVEVARSKGATVRPILLRPREDLPVEAIDSALVDLNKRLQKLKSKPDGRQTLLLMDNVHNPVHFEIACRLMTSPRPWRVWGVARSGEFARLEKGGKQSPWVEIDKIRGNCLGLFW